MSNADATRSAYWYDDAAINIVINELGISSTQVEGFAESSTVAIQRVW